MSERVILVTGANGQMGEAIARGFLAKGDRAVLAVRERRDRVDALVAEFPELAEAIALDVTLSDRWTEVIADIVGRHGRLDVLVNNAGGHDDALLATMSPESWHHVVQLNLDSVFHGCQAVLKQMIGQRGGRIINVASLSALLAPAGQSNYAAAKAGVVALTQSVSKEVARMGITVNAVCPGYIETEALDSMPEMARTAALKSVPARRFGKPSEVAALVRFLASDEAGYITGSAIKIDGGIL